MKERAWLLAVSSLVLRTARDTSLTYVVFELSDAGTLMCSGRHHSPQNEQCRRKDAEYCLYLHLALSLGLCERGEGERAVSPTLGLIKCLFLLLIIMLTYALCPPITSH